jgi:hypothetical protein
LFKKKTISNFTSINNKVSGKTNSILSKDLEKLNLSDFSHLLRENIAVQFCLNLVIRRVKSVEIDFEFFFNNKYSEEYREILRELVLLSFSNWEINPEAYNQLKNILSENISALRLPQIINEKFLNYKPNELVWNKNKINEFNAHMNDTRMGVWCAYNMIISLKRGILNGTSINFQIKKEEKVIKTLIEFEENILNSIKINNELKALLEKEKTNANTVYN